MNSEIVKKVAWRLWPDLAQQPPALQEQGFLIFGLLLTLWPGLPIALLWLVNVTQWPVLQTNGLLLLLLLVAIIILDQRQYVLVMRLREDITLTMTGSLAAIVRISALFLFGPTALWLAVVSGIIKAGVESWQAYRNRDTHVFWYPLTTLLQTSGMVLLFLLLAAATFSALGGRYPLASTTIDQLLPALAAVMVVAVAPGIFYLPMLATLNRLTGTSNSLKTLLPMPASSFLLGVATMPFAIPLALTHQLAGTTVFIFLCIGVMLANLLAYSLSRNNIRSQARADDLSRLESLSEALIQAPADGSTLRAILQDHLPRLFPQSYVTVSLFADPGETAVSWPTFSIQHPQSLPTLLQHTDWQCLRDADEAYLLERLVPAPVPPPFLGNVIMAKIMVSPADDMPPACAGGIYLHRARSVRDIQDVLPTVQELAQQIGAALTRAQTHTQMLAQQKMTQELEFAGRIQSSFLPNAIPQFLGWDISATLIPARQTSGDFYDFVPLGDGRLGLVVADVADKGTGAALYMALSRTLIRTYALQYPDEPGRALAAANERILTDTESDQFVTVFYGVLLQEEQKLIYANAGHNPPFIVGEQVRALAKTGIPLGMFPDMSWEQKEMTLSTADVLVMYSDGVSEAQDVAQAEFGEERLLQIVAGGNGRSAAHIQEAVTAAVQDFVGDAPQFDDITLMVVRQEGAGA